MDMIGRMSDSSYTVGGVGTSPSFGNLLDSLKQDRPFNLTLNNSGFGPSDHATFYAKDIPVLFFFSGVHDEYHTPSDTWQLINLQGEKHILNFIYDLTYCLSRVPRRPIFQKAGPKEGQMSSPSKFTVSFGIMPSYNYTEKGLKVDSISRNNGPAAEAGMKKGDVIKAINENPISDIYEYMDKLSTLKKGMTVPVLIERDNKRMILEVTF